MGGVLASLIFALLLGTGLVSCASDDETTETVTVTLVAESNTSGTSYTIEKGKTIADIQGYTEPKKDGYTFSGWQDSNGKSYSTSTKITASVTLTASWTKAAGTVTNEDGTTTTTTETQNGDGSTTTTAVTKDADGNTTGTKTTTAKSDGSSVTETKSSDGTATIKTVNADKSSSTTTKKTDESGTTTSETVNKDSSGNTTGSTVVTESASSDGTATTTTVEKDASGNVTQTTTVTETQDGKVTTTVTDAAGTTTTTKTQKEYKAYIDAGIKALESETPDLESAVSNFNKAYSTEANDETRVYSALASLASISTADATASFFKNHLGITNYPQKMNSLFDSGWLEAEDYIDYTEEKSVYGYTGFTEKSPYEKTGSVNGYKTFAPASSSTDSWSTYYKCAVEKLDSSESGSVSCSYIYQQAPVNGTTAYFSLYDLENYQTRVNGSSQIGSYYKVTLNENGDCYVPSSALSSDVDTTSATAYTPNYSGSAYINYTYTDTNPDYSGYYRCTIAPADSYVSGSSGAKWSIYKQAEINGETIYADLGDLAKYEKDTTGTTSYTSYYYTYTLDDSGEYYVRIHNGDSSELSSHTLYKESDWTTVDYSYDVHTKFAKLNVPSWLEKSSLKNNLGALLLANIVEGNTNGLNSALDDFYSLIFDSSEYKDAISKLDAITSSVKVPSNVIEDFGLTDITGNTSVKLGPAELGLVKTAFTALKAAIEYFQSYDLNISLSPLKWDWNSNDDVKTFSEKYLTYDSSVDPLKLLTVRSESKMDSSKSDFAEAVGEVIAAYDDILSNTGDYPTAVTDKLDEYKILKSGAEQLKSAITSGGKFYIPDVETEEELKSLSSWPASGETYIDLGNVFTAGYFKPASFLDSDGDGKVTIYKISGRSYDASTDEYYYRLGNKYEYDSSKGIEDIMLGIKISLSPIQNLFGGYDSYLKDEDGISTLPASIRKDSDGNYYTVKEVPAFMAVYIYNFYNDGAASDELKKYLDEIGTDSEDSGN